MRVRVHVRGRTRLHMPTCPHAHVHNMHMHLSMSMCMRTTKGSCCIHSAASITTSLYALDCCCCASMASSRPGPHGHAYASGARPEPAAFMCSLLHHSGGPRLPYSLYLPV